MKRITATAKKTEWMTTSALIKRNVNLFFKDKATFFISMITPVILLVLYVTFLYNVYRSSFEAVFENFPVEDGIVNGLVGGLLLSSLLAVSTMTVSFCSNLGMVADKVTGARNDLTVSPVRPVSLAISYYVSTTLNALICCYAVTVLGLVYLAFTGWYMTAIDVLVLFADVTLLVLFGTALSSLVCFPLTSQGQISAVGTIVSSGYGFLCGAYMPLSQFAAGVRAVMSCLPFTYATSLIRNHAMSGVYRAMGEANVPEPILQAVRSLADCSPEFFGHTVQIWHMYLIVVGCIALLIGAYVLCNVLSAKKRGSNVKRKGSKR